MTPPALPTICDAAAALPAGIPIDGRSFLPQLRGETGRAREWTYCWYAPNQGNVDEPRTFARNHRYKLFRDGAFYELDTPRYEEKRLNASNLTPEAAAARTQLQAALEKYKDARPKSLP